MSNVYRDGILEDVAVMLATSYPDNANTNAFCAAVRSMKSKPSLSRPIRGGPTERHPDAPYCKADQSCCDFVCGN